MMTKPYSSASLSNGKALPSWLSFDAATDTLKGTPGANDTGSVDIAIKATDTGGLSVTDTFQLSVTGGVSHSPVITSDGGGKSASVIITDDTKYVDTVHATDLDPNTTIKYSIVGGENQKLFTINPATGVLSFKSLPKDGHDYAIKRRGI
jgi:Putative Ig domain/Cadherin domain